MSWSDLVGGAPFVEGAQAIGEMLGAIAVPNQLQNPRRQRALTVASHVVGIQGLLHLTLDSDTAPPEVATLAAIVGMGGKVRNSFFSSEPKELPEVVGILFGECSAQSSSSTSEMGTHSI